jgi:hypothetical protein
MTIQSTDIIDRMRELQAETPELSRAQAYIIAVMEAVERLMEQHEKLVKNTNP